MINEVEMVQSNSWSLYVDRSSNKRGVKACLILMNLENHWIHFALRFEFKASNNKVEYEAMITGLRLSCKLKERAFEIFSDSQLVMSLQQKESIATTLITMTFVVVTDQSIAMTICCNQSTKKSNSWKKFVWEKKRKKEEQKLRYNMEK